MRDNPALRDLPLAIGGSRERRGVISTCNYLAREYGIRSAMPTAQALKLCPDLTLIPGSIQKYKAVSQQIMAIFQSVTERIEPLSLDEAYLDVTGVEHCQGSATLIAEELRRRVREEVGITISAGVAPNKFLAKVASDWNKPDGLFVVLPQDVDPFVAALPVKRLSGVGEKTAEKLHTLGVETCLDLRQIPLSRLIERFGRFGQRLFELARGIDERPVKVSRERKSVSVEHTYPRDLPDLPSCLEQLPQLMESLQQRYARLDPPRQIAGAVVKIKFFDFIQTTAEYSVKQPELSHFRQLLSDAYLRGGRPVRLIGVGYRLQPASSDQPRQLSLLAGE
ncbi:DNA polymerase IV [Neptuniibacter halophilus]|uniref:DNA polymerase IV n=1 Tax=Neptuniibacter halophilus TaxID=651666 RepID=UPI0025734A7E|nr:DNA polymerase IV [Neptuniibacter halophilus]